MKLKELRMLTMIRSFFIFAVAMIAATGAFAQGTYTVKSGDALKVEVLEDPNLNRTVLVLPDGTINFPLIGTFQAGGKSLDSVKASLSAALATNFNTPPTVFVSIAALGPAISPAAAALQAAPPTIDIFVMGEVGAPGKMAATPGITILQALAQAGGLTNFAARKRVELRRVDSRTGVMKKYRYNYNGTGKSIKGSTVLVPGDVIVVPARRLFE